jgi:hypothetical protein
MIQDLALRVEIIQRRNFAQRQHATSWALAGIPHGGESFNLITRAASLHPCKAREMQNRTYVQHCNGHFAPGIVDVIGHLGWRKV